MVRRGWVALFVVAGCESTQAPTMIVVPAPPAPPAAEVTEVVLDASPPLAAQPPPEVDGPAGPPVTPFDPKMKTDGTLLLGYDAKNVWLTLVSSDYTVVVDRATGCATEGYPNPKALEALSKSKSDATSEAELAKPEVRAAIRDFVGLGRRVGGRNDHFVIDMTWTPDGRYIFVASNEILYRSTNGGRTFARFDDYASSRLTMGNDGKHLVYERCTQKDCKSCKNGSFAGCNSGRSYYSLPADGSRLALPLSTGYPLEEPAPPGKLRFSHSTGQDICAETYDLASGQLDASVCIPVPPKATGSWPHREVYSVSPSGRYGLVKWEEGRPNLVGAIALTYVVALVDLTTKTTLKTILDISGKVNDTGDVVAMTMQEGGGDHTYLYPLKGPRRLLANRSLMAWEDDIAILHGSSAPGTLATRKCELLKLVKTK